MSADPTRPKTFADIFRGVADFLDMADRCWEGMAAQSGVTYKPGKGVQRDLRYMAEQLDLDPELDEVLMEILEEQG